MATVNDLLASALGGLPTAPSAAPMSVNDTLAAALPDPKQLAVSTVSDAKKSALYQMSAGIGNQAGSASMDPVETDLRSLSNFDLIMKYGPAAEQMISSRTTAASDFGDDQSRNDRTPSMVAGDTVSGVGGGLANAFAGIGALGLGLIDPEAGAGAAQVIQAGNEWLEGTQSEVLNARRRTTRAETALDKRDSDAIYEKDRKETNELGASLRRVGRDTIDSVGNAFSDEVTFMDGTSQAVGSLLGAGPIAKGLKAVGAPILGTARAVGTSETALARLASAGESVAVPASIAAMEAGGAYQGTATEITQRSFSQLEKESPAYRQLVADGMTPEAARAELANRSGLMAAAIQAPIAAATGSLVSRFEGNPFAVPSIASVAGNLARETVEEGIQSGTGQLAQNIGIRENVNPNESLSSGVGEQIGQGAVFGFSAAGTVQAPGAAARTASAAADLGMRGIRGTVGSILERGRQVMARNEAASPVADEAVREATNVAQQTAPADIDTIKQAVEQTETTPEAKAQASEFLDRMQARFNVAPEEISDPSDGVELTAALEGTTNRVDAMQRLADFVANADEGSNDQLNAGYRLLQLNQTIEDFMLQESGALDSLPADSEANQLALKYERLVNNLSNTPKITKALGQVSEMLNRANEQIQDVTDETVNTPEGQQNIKNAVAAAQVDPSNGNLQASENILYQAAQGRVQLTPAEMTAVQAQVAILRAKDAAIKEQARLGLRPMDVVAAQIQTDKGDPNNGKYSATQYTKDVVSAYRAGNRDLAAARLSDFGMFVQHMQNKVDALNTHFATGDPNGPAATYQARNPTSGDWYTSREGMKVRPASKGSVEFAQTVALEAKTLADVFNGLSDALPGLGSGHVDVVSLDPRLDGPAQLVADEFRSRKRTVSTSPVQQAIQEPVAETVTPVVEEAPERNDNQDQPVVVEPESAPREETVTVTPETVEEPVTPVVSTPEPITNKQWTKGDLREIRPDDGRARVVEGPTSITYDRDGDLIKVNIITTKKEGRGQGAARKAMNTLVQMVDAAGLRMQLDVAEQDTATDRQRLMDFYGSMGFEQVDGTDQMIRAAGGQTEAAPAPTGLDAVYPDLVGGDNNYFKKAFTLPETPKTNLTGADAPLSFVDTVLASSDQLTKLVGKSFAGDYTTQVAMAYGDLLEGGAALKTIMEKNLQTYLNAPYSKSNQTPRSEALIGAGIVTSTGSQFEPLRSAEGKALNITDVVDSKVRYNDGLVETAILAGLQWAINADQFGRNLDDAEIAEYAGIDQAYVTDQMRTDLNRGMSTSEAVTSLASKIRAYMGVDTNRNTPEGYTVGIPEGIAKEILRAMETAGLLTVQTVELNHEQGLETPKTINRYVIDTSEDQLLAAGDDNPLRQFPDAIERVVMIEPEIVNFIGEDAMPPVPNTQMNNPGVQNTDADKEAIGKEVQTKFYPNTVMLNVYEAMGEDGLTQAFGVAQSNPDELNEKHAASVEGKNRTIVAGYQSLLSTVAQIDNHARAAGVPMDQMSIRYGYNMSKVGRMQMLGKYTPQSTKLVREALLPTWSTLDLDNQDQNNAFLLAVAQHMGIKVHNFSLNASVQKLQFMLDGGLAPLIPLVQSMNSGRHVSVSSDIEALRDGFATAGADFTPGSLHALSEYARMLESDRTAFRTGLYLEADGKTNGPINAMGLFTLGDFTVEGLKNLGKGGVFFGPEKTANDHTEHQDGDDLYQATTNALKVALSRQREGLRSNAYGLQHSNRLLSLMSMFLPDLNFDESQVDSANGGLDLKRGIAKNPLTITIYGSGAMGIAGNVVDTLTTKMYEQMSLAVQRKNANPSISDAEAIFGIGNPNADALFDQLSVNFEELTTVVARSQKDGSMKFADGEPVGERSGLDPKTFALSPNEFKNLQTNMLTMFVAPLRQAIAGTVGPSLFNAVTRVRKATQVQSIFQKYAFRQMVAEAVEQRSKDPTYRKADFLSRADLDDIQRRINQLSPMIETSDQRFNIAGSSRIQMPGITYSRALDTSMQTDAFTYGPENAGVAGIPLLTIGMGDGKMMQDLARRGLEGTLKIFDGMNMPLDKIMDYSRQANEAVYNSWQGNPISEVLKSYSQFMKRATLDENTDSEMMAELKIALFGWGKMEVPLTSDLVLSEMNNLTTGLRKDAASVDARHEVMQKTAMSFDQMAAAGAPYVNDGQAIPDGATPDEVVTILNDRLTGKYQAPTEVRASEVDTGIAEQLSQVGRAHSSGARVLSYTALQNLSRTIEMTDAQKVIFGEIMRSMAAKQYKVVYGTEQQVRDYQESQSNIIPNTDAMGTVSGYTVVSDQTIYLINPSVETLTHELVHASTVEKVAAFYEGQQTDPQVVDAINRIESLMQQFLDDTADSTDFNDVRAAILNPQTDAMLSDAQAKTISLNEFMAWSLTNEKISDSLKNRPSLIQMAKDVVKFIKQLIWGRKKAPTAGNDALSTLQFNTGVIIRSQPAIASSYGDTVVFQNTWYGDSARLTELKSAFNTKIAQYMKQPLQRGITSPKAIVSDAIIAASQLAMSVGANGFPMTMQESSTFRSIVVALATEAQIDPSSLAQAQQLFQHATKNLRLEDFMEDPNSTDPNDRYLAQQQYDVVMGNYLTLTDVKGRSSLLPVFIGLAMTNSTMRSALSKLALPKRMQADGRTADGFLANLGNTAMDKLTARISGQGNSKNVQDALDNLMMHVQEVIQDDQTFLDQYADRTGGMLDRANQQVVDGMSRLANVVITKTAEIQNTSNNKFVRSAARAIELFSKMATEDRVDQASEGLMEVMNQSNVWRPLADLFNDLIGRTAENSTIYDMIKQVRSVIQQMRQQFREHLPAIIAEKFTRKLTDKEWSNLHRGLGKTDLASLVQGRTVDQVMKMLSDPTAFDSEVTSLESFLTNEDPIYFALYQSKMQQLAKFMVTGEAGKNLLRNAHAISRLFGEKRQGRWKIPSQQAVKAIDDLTSLYAVAALPDMVKNSLASLVQNEAEGIKFSLSYLVGQRADELRKSSSANAQANQYKGYIPVANQPGVQLFVADDTEYAKLIARSFQRVGNYNGSSVDRTVAKKGYYYAPVSGRAAYNQGILQNVRHTSNGVDAVTGFTHDNMIAGRITEPKTVQRITAALANERATSEPLLPIYNSQGVAVAYERSIDQGRLSALNQDDHFAKMIGVWRGRQAEEATAQMFNDKLVDALKKMYDTDKQRGTFSGDEYVNVFDLGKNYDTVIADSVALFSLETLDYIKSVFGKTANGRPIMYVRKDMLNDAIGYRSASVGDVWTGNTRWSDETTRVAKELALGIFGNKAYRHVVNGEKLVQNFVADAKTIIVVKSVVVPVSNLIANFYQLAGRGVPVLHMARQFPKKAVEINQYVESQLKKIRLEADLRAAEGNIIQTRKLNAEIQSINDGHRRLSIWPLIEAGEFTAISDVNLSPDDVEITSGRLNEYIERQVDKLPKSLQTAGRYALITKDTALYQGLAKTIQYGDFIAKAVLYDDLTIRQKKGKDYALGRVSEEFVNYDRLPGRFRGYVEQMGLLWFWNFKIRSAKVAASMIRNNPLHTLLAAVAPAPTMFGSVGLPIEDNLFAKMADGSLDYSVGIGQAFRAPLMNPWVNMVN